MWIVFSTKCDQYCCERHDAGQIRVRAGSEKARKPGYPWVLQAKKWLLYLRLLLLAQLLIVTPCWRLRSLCRAEKQHGAYSSAKAAVIRGLIAQHKPPSSQSWGVVKSQKQVHQHSYPHLSDYRSCLLTPRPDVMWVSALPWCAVDVPFLGTQCISLLTVGPHVQQKEDRDQLKTVEGGIHKPMSFVSLVVSAPLD